jgi:hypothetical protein
MASGEKTSAAKAWRARRLRAAASSSGACREADGQHDQEREVGAVESKGDSRSKAAKDAEPTASQPSPGGSELHAEAVLEELGAPKAPAKRVAKEPSKRGAQVTLRGRFPAGTPVQLVKVAGAHVLRTLRAMRSWRRRRSARTARSSSSRAWTRTRGISCGGTRRTGRWRSGCGAARRRTTRRCWRLPPVGYDEVRTRDGRVYGERGQRIPDAGPSGAAGGGPAWPHPAPRGEAAQQPR